MDAASMRCLSTFYAPSFFGRSRENKTRPLEECALY
jgi:hypothetical protein